MITLEKTSIKRLETGIAKEQQEIKGYEKNKEKPGEISLKWIKDQHCGSDQYK